VATYARGSGSDVTANASRPGQVASLDWVLGWFLVVAVATVSVLGPRPDQLVHATWFGVTVQDLVLPLFVTLSGAGLAFAYRDAVGLAVTLRRGVVLLLCGLAYNMVVAGSVEVATLRWTGALQVYAVVVLLVGLLHKVVRGPVGWAMLTGVVALGQGTMLLVWQAACGGTLSFECNPSGTVDTAVLGAAHMYAEGRFGHDPEGLVAVLGALLTGCVGVVAGHLALRARHGDRAPAYLLGWAVLVMGAALASAALLPAMRRLWTTPFALGAASLGVVLLAAGLAVLDRPVRARWGPVRERLAWPLVAMGRNSVLVFFGSQLLMVVLLTQQDRYGHPWAHVLSDWVEPFVLGHNRAGVVLTMLVLWASVAALLHWRRIYLRP
jgi:heparan-alpha-glucosaminide N-acetyltransferase